MVQPRFAKALPTPRPLVQVRFDESLSLLRILRRVIPCGGPVSSPADNAEHSRLAELASRDKLLQGMSREQVEDTLGKGEPCAQHELCGKKGFDPRDLYYEVGTAGSYVRYRPALIVGFDDWGKVARTFVLEVR